MAGVKGSCIGWSMDYTMGFSKLSPFEASIDMPFGRSNARILRTLPKAHLYIWYFLLVLMRIRRPLTFLRCYLRRTTVPGSRVEFRDGTIVQLSGDKDDLATIFSIFIRAEYPLPPPGATVLDVGANIGVFALWIMKKGAGRVFCYEPCSESFAILKQNLALNRLDGVACAERFAVGAQDGETLFMPVSSCTYNAPVEVVGGGEAGGAAHEEVSTISIPGIVAKHGLERIDYAKIDCEGAEYEILPNLPAETLRRIGLISLEYHRGNPSQLAGLLTDHDFAITRNEAYLPHIGYILATRPETVNG